MNPKSTRMALYLLSHAFSEDMARKMSRVFSKKLVEQVRGQATNDFLIILLRFMDLAFLLNKGYRKNLENFSSRFVFISDDGKIGVTADFRNGRMSVRSHANEDWTARVTFKDATALRNYLFSQDQDIMESLLANDVRVEGNLNHVFKFGYMAFDLERRLGILGNET